MSSSNQQVTIDNQKRIVVPFDLQGAKDIAPGSVYTVTKTDNEIILNPTTQKNAPYRIYSSDELKQFIQDDTISS